MQAVPPIFKNTAHNSPKHVISSDKIHFGGRDPHSLPQRSLLDPPLRPPEFQPDIRLPSKSCSQCVSAVDGLGSQFRSKKVESFVLRQLNGAESIMRRCAVPTGKTRWLYCVECPQYSTRLEGVAGVTDCQSDRQTDRPRYSVRCGVIMRNSVGYGKATLVSC